MNNDDWNDGNILGFCGASVQKLERMSLDVTDSDLLKMLESAKMYLRNAYKLLKEKK